MVRSSWRASMLVAVVGMTLSAAHGALVQTKPIAVVGMAAPDTAYTYSNVENQFGIVGGYLAFIANTSGPFPNDGIWADHGSGVHLAAYDGATVPGAPGTIFAPDNVTLDGNGNIAFTTMGLQGFSIVKKNSTGLSLVMLGDGPAPGTASTFGIPGRAYMDEHGGVSFQSGITSGVSGVWTNAFTGSLQNIALAGNAAPGGGVYWNIGSDLAVGGGKIVHVVSIVTSGVLTDCVVSHSAAGDQLIARTGSSVPGLPTSTFSSFSTPAVSAQGHVFFTSRFSNSHQGLMADVGSGLAPLFLDGNAAPGISGGKFSTFSAVNLAGNDRYAFTATATSTFYSGSKSGIWSTGPTGSPQLVALQYASAPELTGKAFDSFDTFAISDNGLTAFTARVSPADRSSQEALYVQDYLGNLNLIACEGKAFEILPGQFATVKDIVFNNSFHSPRTQAFSGNSLAFWLQFDDGRSGLYTATVGIPGDATGDGLVDQDDYAIWYNHYGSNAGAANGDFNNDGLIDQDDYAIWYDNYGNRAGGAVPEPATLGLLLLGGIGMLRRRQR